MEMSDYVNLQCHFCLSSCTVCSLFLFPPILSLLVMPSQCPPVNCLVLCCLKLSLGFCFSPVTFTLISATFLYRSSLLPNPLFSRYSCQISLCNNLIHIQILFTAQSSLFQVFLSDLLVQ
jgi:hypothetical protein